MADPVSIVASIVGIAAFGLSVAVSLHRTISAVANAPESAKSLQVELRIFCAVLDTLADKINDGATPPPVVTEILSCLDVEFRALGKLVDSYQNVNVNTFMRAVNRVIWKFKTDEINEKRDGIGRLQQLLGQALIIATNSQTVALRREEHTGQPDGQREMYPPYKELPPLYLTALSDELEIRTQAPSASTASQMASETNSVVFKRLHERMKMLNEEALQHIYRLPTELENRGRMDEVKLLIMHETHMIMQRAVQGSEIPKTLWRRGYATLRR